ncbi:hypothetical protein VTI74DRAFT_8093 [Chaetomium olivicolor]
MEISTFSQAEQIPPNHGNLKKNGEDPRVVKARLRKAAASRRQASQAWAFFFFKSRIFVSWPPRGQRPGIASGMGSGPLWFHRFHGFHRPGPLLGNMESKKFGERPESSRSTKLGRGLVLPAARKRADSRVSCQVRNSKGTVRSFQTNNQGNASRTGPPVDTRSIRSPRPDGSRKIGRLRRCGRDRIRAGIETACSGCLTA